MHKTIPILAAMIFASATQTFASSTAELKEIGKITPGSCIPAFDCGDIVDYGKISQNDLSATTVTTLSSRRITYTITCNAPVVIATAWSDNRSSSSTRALTDFGLGFQGAVGIGYFRMTHVLASTQADGSQVRNVASINSGANWAGVNGTVTHSSSLLYSYAPLGTTNPTAYSNYSGALDVTARIAATNSLNMAAPLVLDGLATMEVRYL